MYTCWTPWLAVNNKDIPMAYHACCLRIRHISRHELDSFLTDLQASSSGINAGAFEDLQVPSEKVFGHCQDVSCHFFPQGNLTQQSAHPTRRIQDTILMLLIVSRLRVPVHGLHTCGMCHTCTSFFHCRSSMLRASHACAGADPGTSVVTPGSI